MLVPFDCRRKQEHEDITDSDVKRHSFNYDYKNEISLSCANITKRKRNYNFNNHKKESKIPGNEISLLQKSHYNIEFVIN